MTSVSPLGSSTTERASAYAGRQTPWSNEAEQAVLGAMLLDQDAALKAAELLDDTMFYREGHRLLFRSMIALTERGDVIDPVTLRDELLRRGDLDRAGGMEYLGGLIDVVPTAANVEYHAKIVRDKAVLRRLIEAATAIIQDAYEGRSTSIEVLDNAEHRVFQVAQFRRAEEFVRLKELIWPTMERIEQLHTSQGALTGVATGFTDLDRLTAGFQRGDLVIAASRPAARRRLPEARPRRRALGHGADLDRRLGDALAARDALQGAPPQGGARRRVGGGRLPADDAGPHGLGEPPAGDLLHFPLAEGTRQGARRSRGGVVPALARPRAARRRAPAPPALGSARVRRDRAGRRRRVLHLSPGVLRRSHRPQDQREHRGDRGAHRGQAAQRPHRHRQAVLQKGIHPLRQLHAARITPRGRPWLRAARCSAARIAARSSPSGADAARRAGRGIRWWKRRSGGPVDGRTGTRLLRPPDRRSACPPWGRGRAWSGGKRASASSISSWEVGSFRDQSSWWGESPVSGSPRCCCSARRGSSRREFPRCTCPVRSPPIRFACGRRG